MKKNILILILCSLVFIACEEQVIEPIGKSFEAKIDYTKINEVITNATQLTKQVSEIRTSKDNYCTGSFRKLKYKDRDYSNFERINVGYIKTPEAHAELQKILGDKDTADAFAKEVEAFYVANEKNIYDWTGICKKNKEVYAFFTPVNDPSFLINIWKGEGNGFSEYFHDENMNINYFGGDGATSSFLIDAQNGNSLIYRAGRDLPMAFWSIDSLDPEKLLVTRIEDCKLNFEYTSKPFFVNPDKSTLTCDKQYKP